MIDEIIILSVLLSYLGRYPACLPFVSSRYTTKPKEWKGFCVCLRVSVVCAKGISVERDLFSFLPRSHDRNYVKAVGILAKIVAGYELLCRPPQALLLLPIDKLPGIPESFRRTGLDFNENQRLSVQPDQIQLASPTAEPACEYVESLFQQEATGDPFPQASFQQVQRNHDHNVSGTGPVFQTIEGLLRSFRGPGRAASTAKRQRRTRIAKFWLRLGCAVEKPFVVLRASSWWISDGAEAVVKNGESAVHLFSAYDQRGAEADAVLPASEQQQAALVGFLQDPIPQRLVPGVLGGARLDDLDRLHQPEPARIAYECELFLEPGKSPGQLFPLDARVLHTAIFDQFDRLQRGGARDRVAAKSGSMGSRRPIHQGLPSHNGP